MRQIIFYQKQNWKFPMKDFLNELVIKNPELYAKILQKIDLLLLDRLWNDEVKYIWDKIYELRIKQSSNISRIFYFTIQDKEIVLLDWIIKKSQKLDNYIIKKVKNYKDDYINKNNL